MISSLSLVLEHVAGLKLPGCGEGSPCAEAANSVWGKIPITGGFAWPVSFVGFAYFISAFVAWAMSRQTISPLLRLVSRLGLLISVGFLIVIFGLGYHCKYCLVAHAGNIVFWVIMELTLSAPKGTLRPVFSLAAVFLVTSGVLLGAELRTRSKVNEQQEKDLAQSTKEIIEATAQKSAIAKAEATKLQPPQPSQPQVAPKPQPTTQAATIPPAAGNVPPKAAGSTTTAVATKSSTPEIKPILDCPTTAPTRPWKGAFRGRYLYGSEQSPVRLLMFTDYQCTDCNRIEKEVRAMLQERTDVSLTIKHFPMCSDCNRHFTSKMHPNACWAARAAETAGILGGNDAFWKMHFWLFDRTGSFTDQDLNQGIIEQGFDPTQFIQIMTSEQTLQLVQQDVEEGVWVGLHFTPMVFINGVELRGVFAQGAIPRAVAAVAAQNPPAMNHDLDQPPSATDKAVGDWKESYARTLPPDRFPWANGADNAAIKIVLWGDYLEPYTADADRRIRQWIKGKPDVQYSFRHFPFDQSCNPVVSRTIHPKACRAAQAVEAAGQLGGVEGYWKMHTWLMEHQKEMTKDSLKTAATAMGFEDAAFQAAMSSPQTKENIEEDCRAAKPQPTGEAGMLLYRGGIPTIFINGKVVPRWNVDGYSVLEKILEYAYTNKPQ